MCGLFGYTGGQTADPSLMLAAAQAGQRGPHAHGWYAHGWYAPNDLTHGFGPLNPALVPSTVRRLIGHARLATYGDPRDPAGIQPILHDGHAVVHNGNMDNWRDAWPGEELPSDSWAIAKLYTFYRQAGATPMEALNTMVWGELGESPHAVLILDHDGALLSSRQGMPLHINRTLEGNYLSSTPFPGSTPAPDGPHHVSDDRKVSTHL